MASGKKIKITILAVFAVATLSCFVSYCLQSKSSESCGLSGGKCREKHDLHGTTVIDQSILKENCIYWDHKKQKACVIDEGSIESKINEVLSNSSKSIVVCCATWCGPCIKLKQFLGEYSSDIHKNVDIIIINSDKTSFDVLRLPNMLGSDRKLSGYPTIYCVKSGKVSSTIVGFGYSTKNDLSRFAIA